MASNNTNKQISLEVPDIGDASEIELVAWHVSLGDWVEEGDELCELVTEKAAFPLESPYNGRVKGIEKSAGDKVEVGEKLLLLEVV